MSFVSRQMPPSYILKCRNRQQLVVCSRSRMADVRRRGRRIQPSVAMTYPGTPESSVRECLEVRVKPCYDGLDWVKSSRNIITISISETSTLEENA